MRGSPNLVKLSELHHLRTIYELPSIDDIDSSLKDTPRNKNEHDLESQDLSMADEPSVALIIENHEK